MVIKMLKIPAERLGKIGCLSRRACAVPLFAIIVLQMYCNYKCSVALPHGAVGWSALCDCGVS